MIRASSINGVDETFAACAFIAPETISSPPPVRSPAAARAAAAVADAACAAAVSATLLPATAAATRAPTPCLHFSRLTAALTQTRYPRALLSSPQSLLLLRAMLPLSLAARVLHAAQTAALLFAPLLPRVTAVPPFPFSAAFLISPAALLPFFYPLPPLLTRK